MLTLQHLNIAFLFHNGEKEAIFLLQLLCQQIDLFFLKNTCQKYIPSCDFVFLIIQQEQFSLLKCLQSNSQHYVGDKAQTFRLDQTQPFNDSAAN